jgi:uncharacterized protein YbcI
MVDEEHAPSERRLNRAIANAVVRSHSRIVGRGPTRANSFYRHNVIVVVAGDFLTPGERSLAAGGDEQSVHRLRSEFQQMMREELVSEVEGLTRRKVLALMSATHLDPDLAAQVFVLDGPVAAESPDPPPATSA